MSNAIERQLEDFLGEDLHTELVEKREAFVVDTVEKANWCLTTVKRAEENIATLTVVAEAYARKVQDWLAQAISKDEETVERMAEFLKPWAELEIAKRGGKGKTVKLIDGEVSLKKAPDHLDVIDEAKALVALPLECIRVVPEERHVDKRETMKRIKAGGEVPEGIEYKTGETGFSIRVTSSRVIGETTRTIDMSGPDGPVADSVDGYKIQEGEQ